MRVREIRVLNSTQQRREQTRVVNPLRCIWPTLRLSFGNLLPTRLIRSRRLESSPVRNSSREMASALTLAHHSFAFSKKVFFTLILFSIYPALLGVTNTKTDELKERCTWVSFIFVISISGRKSFSWALAPSCSNCFAGRIDAMPRRLADLVGWSLVLRISFCPPAQPTDWENSERRRRVTADLHPSYCDNHFINNLNKLSRKGCKWQHLMILKERVQITYIWGYTCLLGRTNPLSLTQSLVKPLLLSGIITRIGKEFDIQLMRCLSAWQGVWPDQATCTPHTTRKKLAEKQRRS